MAHIALTHILLCAGVICIVPYLLLREETGFHITWRPQTHGRSSLTSREINLLVFKLSTVAPIWFEVLPFQGPQNFLSAVIQIISP